MKSRFISTLLGILLLNTGISNYISGQPRMVVNSFTGAVTSNEINSFKAHIQAVVPDTSGNYTPGNEWTFGKSANRTRSLGLMYEMTKDQDILDRMIFFTDAVLSQRNDLAPAPLGQKVLWTGNIEPAWPNSTVQPIYSYGEQGDPIGHMAYCARLILETPAIWNTDVRIGDSYGYGTTYLQRANRYITEAKYTLDQHILTDVLDFSNNNRMYWKTGHTLGGQSVPWNQQVMFTYAFHNLALALDILGNDPTRASDYYAKVQAFCNWFFSGESGCAQPYTNSKGNTSYLWAYRTPSGIEDCNHGNLDFQGLYRAYSSGKYNITFAQMLPLANTFMDVVKLGNDSYAGRVNGTSGTGNSSPTTYIRQGWLPIALFRPADYITIMSEDLTVGGTTSDISRYSYFLWIKNMLYGLPTAPSALTAIASSDTQIELSWTDNSVNEASFTIERSLDGSSWTTLTSTAAYTTSYSDTGLNASTMYFYRINAVNPNGSSAFSNTVSATTPCSFANIALNKTATASSTWSTSYAASKSVDGSYSTRWAAASGVTAATLDVDFGGNYTFSQVVLREFASRVFSFKIQYWNGTDWLDAYTGTTIGTTDKTINFQAVTGTKVRLNILTCSVAAPTIYEFVVNGYNCTMSGIKTKIESNTFTVNQLNAYPNPAENYFMLQSATEFDRIEISTLAGVVLKSIKNEKGMKNIKISVTDLASGIYLCKSVFENNVSEVTRLIVNRK